MGVPAADPDIAVSRAPWPRRLLGLYFPATYRATCAKGGKRAARRLRLEQLAHDTAVVGTLIGLFLLGGVGLVALAVVPPLVIAPVITFTFSYLPHRPFPAAGRYRDTLERRGDTWVFVERAMVPTLFGDLQHHLLFDLGPADG